MYRGNSSLFKLAVYFSALGVAASSFGDNAPSQAITLNEALRRAWLNNPRLQVYEARSEAADGLIEQAGFKPNPTLSTEFENFLGSGPFSGVDSLEITVVLNQLIERGDKRARRTELAQSRKELIAWNLALYRAELRYSVHRAFADVLIGQESVNLNRDLLQLAGDSLDAVNILVESARASNVEASRARLALRQQEFELQRAEYALANAKANLAALWGKTTMPEFQATGEITLKENLPSLESLTALLDHTPDLARYNAELRERESALELEKARARQDVTAFAGLRGTNDSGDAAFLAGFEIPLPIRDRNQGNIRAALAEVRQAAAEQESQKRDLLTTLVANYRNLLQAYEEARTLKTDLLPAAESTQVETEEAYRRGQFTLVAVLESRRALFDIRHQYLEALQRYQQALAVIERLTLPARHFQEY